MVEYVLLLEIMYILKEELILNYQILNVCIHNRKMLLGTFYRPPNSLPAVLDSIENSIGIAFDSNAHVLKP